MVVSLVEMTCLSFSFLFLSVNLLEVKPDISSSLPQNVIKIDLGD